MKILINCIGKRVNSRERSLFIKDKNVLDLVFAAWELPDILCQSIITKFRKLFSIINPRLKEKMLKFISMLERKNWEMSQKYK